MRKIKLFLSYGHYPHFTGAVSTQLNKGILYKYPTLEQANTPLYEADLNFYIGEKLEEMLEGTAWYTITKPEYDILSPKLGKNLRQRVKLANDVHCDLFFEVHFNSCLMPSVWGTEIITSLGETESDMYATNILNQITDSYYKNDLIKSNTNICKEKYNHPKWLDFKNRGEKDMNKAVLVKTHMPALIWEVEFISNKERVLWALDKDNQKIMFTAIHKGILQTWEQLHEQKGCINGQI